MTEIAAGLRELRRPHDGQPLVAEVWTRDEAFAGPYEAIGPDLSMVLADGGTMSILPSETLVSRRDAAARAPPLGGHVPRRRAGIRTGAQVDELSIVDVAPLILYRLGLAGPRRHGRAACPASCSSRASSSAGRRASSRRRGAPAPVLADPAELALDPEEQAASWTRLRALGYVE